VNRYTNLTAYFRGCSAGHRAAAALAREAATTR